MAGVKEERAVPDFLRMDGAVGSDPANAEKTGSWHGWPTKEISPVTLKDNEGRTVRIIHQAGQSRRCFGDLCALKDYPKSFW